MSDWRLVTRSLELAPQLTGNDLRAAAWLATIVVIALLFHGLGAPLDFDEHYHLAAIEKILAEFPSVDLLHTPAATPVLYHLIVAGTAPLAANAVAAARITSAVMSVVALWGIYWLASRKLVLKYPLWTTVLIALHPAFLWHSGLIMTELPSLCWAVLGLVCLTTIGSPHWAAISSGVCVSAAIWTRQTWVLLPAALLITAWRNFRRDRVLNGPLIIAGCSGLLAAAGLFLLWKGFSPPGEYASTHGPTLNLFQPFLGLALVGLYLPMLALSWWPGKRVIVYAAVTAALAPLPGTSPIHTYLSGATLENPQGALQGILNLTATRLSPQLAAALLIVLVGIGTIGLARIVRVAKGAPGAAFSLLCLAVLAVELLVIPQNWERYWSAAVPMIVLPSMVAMERKPSSGAALVAQYAYLVALSVAYFLYQLF